MKKIIVYGAGKRAYEQMKYWVEVFNVIAIVDQNELKWGKNIENIVISPTRIINDFKYDFILISTETILEKTIRHYLIHEFGIDNHKIINSMDAINIAMKEKREKIVKPKVYDCFMFFNELELLKIRLEMLSPYVDYFVLVELDKNFKGEKKELYYKQNKELYKEYGNKIIYVSPTNVPVVNITPGIDDWTIETFQRKSISCGLENTSPDDLVIISDLDEFPNPDKIADACKYGSELSNKLDNMAIVMEQKLFYYYFDNMCDRKWRGSIFCKSKNLLDIQWLRDYRNRLCYENDGGWHFSYLGGLERIKQKNISISDGKIYTDDVINNVLKTGELMDSNWGEKTIRISTENHDFPNIDKCRRKFPELFMCKE